MLEEKEKEVGKDNVDFQSMVKEIAQKWKALVAEDRKRVEMLAKEDLQRYKDEVRAYEEAMVERNRKEREESALKKRQEEEAEAVAKAARQERERIAALRATSTETGALIRNRAFRDGMPVTDRADEMRMVLMEELRIIEAARDMKLQQLAELQAGISPNNLSGVGIPQKAVAGDLSGLGSIGASGLSAEAELQILRQRQALSTGLSAEAEIEVLRRRQALAAAGHGLTTPSAAQLAELSGVAAGQLGAAGVAGLGMPGAYGELAAGSAMDLARQDIAAREAMMRSIQEREGLLSAQLQASRAGAAGMLDYTASSRAALSNELALGRGTGLLQALGLKGERGIGGAHRIGDDSNRS